MSAPSKSQNALHESKARTAGTTQEDPVSNHEANTPCSTGIPRIACIDIPELGLQYAEQARCIAPDKPHILIEAHVRTPRILALNAAAQQRGLHRGMRLQEAQSVCEDIFVSTENTEAIAEARQTICARLEEFSPWIERHPQWPNSLWIRGDGLSSLWPSATQWGQSIHTSLMLQGWKNTVIVGFSRFFALAIARQHPGHLRVLTSPDQERVHALRTPLHFLIADPALRIEFETLGMHTLDDLYQLPLSAVQRRYGKEAAQWIQWVQYEHSMRSRAIVAPQVYRVRPTWDSAVIQHDVLLFRVQKPLRQLFSKIQRAGYSCDTLHVKFFFEWGRLIDDRLQKSIRDMGIEPYDTYQFTLQAAFAHLDEVRWTELLRLRLSRLKFPLGVIAVEIQADAVRAEIRQETWKEAGAPQVPDALLEALARIRAELGDQAVGHLDIEDAHLPETRNPWRSLRQLTAPNPHPLWTPHSLRRIYPRIHPLPTRANESELRAWLQTQNQSLSSLHGPYIVSGAWWQKPVERAYYYAVLGGGETLWVYYDRVRMQWMWQGNVY